MSDAAAKWLIDLLIHERRLNFKGFKDCVFSNGDVSTWESYSDVDKIAEVLRDTLQSSG